MNKKTVTTKQRQSTELTGTKTGRWSDIDAPNAIDDMLVSDAAATKQVPADKLTVIMAQAAELRMITQRIAKGVQVMGLLLEQQKILQENVLPNLMAEAGLKVLQLVEGDVLEVEDKVYASISKKNQALAAEQLEAGGHGAIVKRGFMVEIDKGNMKAYKLVRRTIKTLMTKAAVKQGVFVEERCNVHAQTLLAYVRERIRDAKPIPKAITHHEQPTVTLAQPKQAKRSKYNG